MYFVRDISSMRYVALRQRDKGIYIISQPNEMRLYRICEANISNEHERVYRQYNKNILMVRLFQRYKFLTEFVICTSYAIYLRCDILPCGKEIKEFISSYRNATNSNYLYSTISGLEKNAVASKIAKQSAG